MILSAKAFLIVCPLLFLAGFVDSIAGGGGLISLPAFLLAGLPAHAAIATNKLSSACGTTLTTARFIKNRLIDARLALPGIAAAIVGSTIGARLSLMVDEAVVRVALLFVLPVAAFVVLNRRLFPERENDGYVFTRKGLVACTLAAFVIGGYDGFYGPGAGTFLIIAFMLLDKKMSVGRANAQAKAVNLTSNLTALAVFALNGQVVVLLGLAGAACSMLGNYVGSGMAMEKGTRITRPIILVVLALLFVRIILGG